MGEEEIQDLAVIGQLLARQYHLVRHSSSSLRCQALRWSGSTTAFGFTIASLTRTVDCSLFVPQSQGSIEACHARRDGQVSGWRSSLPRADGRTEPSALGIEPRRRKDCMVLDMETLGVGMRARPFPLSRLGQAGCAVLACDPAMSSFSTSPPRRDAILIAGPRSQPARSNTARSATLRALPHTERN